MEGYHENEPSDGSRELHRAIKSLMEELEAVDGYQQRIDASSDEALRAILAHNRGEELEHAAVVSIGYAASTRDTVELYITESFTFESSRRLPSSSASRADRRRPKPQESPFSRRGRT